jgi:chemotaxis signal transduction protein
MSGHEARSYETADELRQAFDRSFALARDTGTDTAIVRNLLAVRVGAHSYALRTAEVSGLFVDKKITWLPSPVSELLGIAGLRGSVLPVYDLGMLLGCPRSAAPRWLLVTAASPVGLAFDGLDGFLSVRPEAIVPDVRPESRERHVREILHTEVARPIIHLPSVLETIRNRGAHDRPN